MELRYIVSLVAFNIVLLPYLSLANSSLNAPSCLRQLKNIALWRNINSECSMLHANCLASKHEKLFQKHTTKT